VFLLFQIELLMVARSVIQPDIFLCVIQYNLPASLKFKTASQVRYVGLELVITHADHNSKDGRKTTFNIATSYRG